MEFFKTISSRNNSTSNVNVICENATHLQIFNHENPQKIVSHIKRINLHLSVKKNAHIGLAHLLLFLPQCPKDLLVSHGEQWVRLCLLALKFQNPGLFSPILTAITYIFKQCYINSELRKSISRLDSKIVLSLSRAKPQCFSEVCECLFEYVRLFPTQALPHKADIESISLLPLKNPSYYDLKEVVMAGKVFVSLPFPGNVDVLYNAKGAHLDQLISLCHSSMDDIFSCVQENEEYAFPREHKLPTPTLSPKKFAKQPMMSMLSAAPVLFNCLIYIQNFLSCSSTNFVLLKPKELVLVAFRLLQVDSNMLRKCHGIESTTLSFILPSIHVRALEYLKVLINSRLCHLFLNLVEELLVGILKSSFMIPLPAQSNLKDASCREQNQRVILSVKILCYQCLIDVVKVSNGCHVAQLQELLPVLISDLMPEKDHLKMRSTVRGSRVTQMKIGKKTKKKGYTVLNENDGVYSECSHDDVSKRSRDARLLTSCACAALSYVESLFLHAHHAVDIKCVMVLYNRLANLAMFSPDNSHDPFASDSVRLVLFKALSSYCLYPHPLCPPNYAALLRVFQQGTLDSNKEISGVSSIALATLSFATANPSVTDTSDVIRLSREKLKESELFEREINGKIADSLSFTISNSNTLSSDNGDITSSSLKITQNDDSEMREIDDSENDEDKSREIEDSENEDDSRGIEDSEVEDNDSEYEAGKENDSEDGNESEENNDCLPSPANHQNGKNDVSSSAMETSDDSDASNDSEHHSKEMMFKLPEELTASQSKRKNEDSSTSPCSKKKIKEKEIAVSAMLESFIDADSDDN